MNLLFKKFLFICIYFNSSCLVRIGTSSHFQHFRPKWMLQLIFSSVARNFQQGVRTIPSYSSQLSYPTKSTLNYESTTHTEIQ